MSKTAPRSAYMSRTQAATMVGARTHQNCIERTGVARPGKTAHDRAKKQK